MIMTANSLRYQDVRESIQTGDVLVWKKDRLSKISNLFLWGIRFFTMSQFAHVAVAVRIMDRVFIIEATQPFVRIFPLSNSDEFYHIPTHISEPSKESLTFLFDQVGKLYSLGDAIRGYLGYPLKDNDRWQCVELAKAFLNMNGFNVKGTIASDLVDELLLFGHEISLVIPKEK